MISTRTPNQLPHTTSTQYPSKAWTKTTGVRSSEPIPAGWNVVTYELGNVLLLKLVEAVPPGSFPASKTHTEEHKAISGDLVHRPGLALTIGVGGGSKIGPAKIR